MNALLAELMALPVGGEAVAGLLPRRAEAALEKMGLPGHGIESWKYTPLNAVEDIVLKRPMRPAPEPAETLLADAVEHYLGGALPNHRLVFCNAVYCPWLSRLPPGARFVCGDIGDFATADSVPERSDEAIVWLALARAASAWHLHLPAAPVGIDQNNGTTHESISNEIHVLHLGQAAAVFALGRIELAAGASYNWIEHQLAAGGGFANHYFSFVLAAGSHLEHLRIAPARPAAIVLQRTAVEVAAGAYYRLHDLAFGARLARHEVRVNLVGKRAECALHGVAVPVGRHTDNDWSIIHQASSTTSRQTFRAVAKQGSRAACSARSFIPQNITLSDTRQSLHGLLLDATSEIQLRPVLEILNDEVCASHGAGVGQLDPDALYYLQSRGLPAGEARRLLIAALLDQALAADLAAHLKRPLCAALESAALPAGGEP